MMINNPTLSQIWNRKISQLIQYLLSQQSHLHHKQWLLIYSIFSTISWNETKSNVLLKFRKTTLFICCTICPISLTSPSWPGQLSSMTPCGTVTLKSSSAINDTTIYNLTTAFFYDIDTSYFNKICAKLYDCVTHIPSTKTPSHTPP